MPKHMMNLLKKNIHHNILLQLYYLREVLHIITY